MSTILQDLEDDITSECWMQMHSAGVDLPASTALDTVITLTDFISDHHNSCWDNEDYPDASSSSPEDDDDDDVIMATKRVSLDATATATTTSCTGWTTNNDDENEEEDAVTPFELMDVDKDPILSQSLPISISFIETAVDHNFHCWEESGLFDTNATTSIADEASRNVSISSNSNSKSIPHNQSMDTTSAAQNDDDDEDNDPLFPNNNHTTSNHWSRQFQERRRQLAISMAASQKTRQVLRLKEHVRRRANLLKVLSDIEKSSKIIQIHLYDDKDDDNDDNRKNDPTHTMDVAPTSSPSIATAI